MTKSPLPTTPSQEEDVSDKSLQDRLRERGPGPFSLLGEAADALDGKDAALTEARKAFRDIDDGTIDHVASKIARAWLAAHPEKP